MLLFPGEPGNFNQRSEPLDRLGLSSSGAWLFRGEWDSKFAGIGT